jgi:hypothetical protein
MEGLNHCLVQMSLHITVINMPVKSLQHKVISQIPCETTVVSQVLLVPGILYFVQLDEAS